MTESNTGKRVLFPKGKQKAFVERILRSLYVKEAAKICACSERTIRDWRREKFSMDYDCLLKICKATNSLMPQNITLRDKYEHCSRAGLLAGKVVMEKYGRVGGDPEHRKQKWYEWWENEGQYNPDSITKPKPITTPRKSVQLAEFCGIMLGDGGMSDLQATVSLNRVDDAEYVTYVCNLLKKLFDIEPALYPSNKDLSIAIVISRAELVRFCQKLGLVTGNKIKQQIDIPRWIKKNPKYQIACMRGLVDTDGSVFTHKYKVAGKWYQYKKLSYCSRSEPLLKSAHAILAANNITSRFTTGFEIRIDSKASMQKYFEIISSHNPKHLKRYKK